MMSLVGVVKRYWGWGGSGKMAIEYNTINSC